ncbi:phage tail tape measure protein [Donghicola mangrovi]|uniref:Phage tail tape measure protein n=1 Tax=Donghicola mangrovi TaxID=2729614 RepID=A0A850Q163_9RHOB|nr:phage tail tape measure protein [Donghicola mangrovi]NVO22826.1 phage tail tape measure protein [Donghicola mangrovi]
MTENLDALQDDLDRLEQSLDGAASLTRGFEAELTRMREGLGETTLDMRRMERGMSSGLRKAFDAVVLDGARLSDSLTGLGQSMVNAAYTSAVKPVTDQVGGLLAGGIGALMTGVKPFANGGAFVQGRVMPFAKGGVVSAPTSFPMKGATGLMGEAGPEAIMPLTRGPDGALGVRASGGALSVQVVMNIQTPDAEGFRRSQSQIAARMGRVIGQAQRNR